MIPHSWTSVELGEIVEKPQYGHTAKATSTPTGPRFLRITDIQNSRVDWSSVPGCEISDRDAVKYALADNDIVFARTGATTGKSYLVTNCPSKAVFASYLIRIRPRPGVEPRFLWYFFHSARYWEQITEKRAGIAQPGVNANKLKTLEVVLAPLAEQRRIVAEIEKQFTRLDAAVANLQRVKANLERARASVLKAAVEGRLVPTEAELARAEGRDYEPASVVLERILAGRERRHQETNGKRKYKAPAEADTDGLPEGWIWATVDQVALSLRYGTSAKCSVEDLGIPVLRMGNIVNGRLVYEGLKYLPADHEEFPEQLLRAGEVLFNRTNSPELVGKTAVFSGYVRPVACASYLIRVDPGPGVVPEFLVHSINSPRGRAWIKTVVTQQVGQANVNGTKLRNHVFPLPPVAEQRRISGEVARRFSVFDSLERSVETNLARCQRLQLSLLKRAFEGSLVPQDPTDEPATELLARVGKEAETTTARRSRKAPETAARRKKRTTV